MDGEGLGRSRGGLNTKIHLATDGRGLPMSVVLTGGQAGDDPQLLPVLEGIRVARNGPGRPRTRPDAVVVDRASAHPSTRAAVRRRKVRFISPGKTTQVGHPRAKGNRGGRAPLVDEVL